MAKMKDLSAAKKLRQERILAALRRWPDMKYVAIARRLEIKEGTLLSDLHELRKAGRIAFRKASTNEFDVAKRRRKILDLLFENPRLTVRELARIMNEPFYLVNMDKRLLTKAGLTPKGVRSCRRAVTPYSDELLKRVANADDSGRTAKEIAMKLGVKDAVIKQARQVIALKSGRGLDRDFEADRDFRRRQREYHSNQNVTYKARKYEGLLGVRLPEEEHKRYMHIRELKKQGLSWSEKGVCRTHGHGVRKTQYALKGVSLIRNRMRERGLVTELQGKGYRFNRNS